MKRSTFNRIVASSIGVAFLPRWLSGKFHEEYPYKTLSEAFNALGFDSTQKGRSFFVVTADVHYGAKGADGMRETVREVNEMNPQPAFFCVNGDLVMNGSRSFGAIPDAEEKALARQEFHDFRADADLLHPKIPLKLTLGNHDTHPGEIDPRMFWEVYPGYPPYQSMNVEDVHMIFLNGHSTGYVDPAQMQWLSDDINKTSVEKTLIVFVHQPSMSHTVRERGIPEAIMKAFANHKGAIWLIGGHEHTNGQKIFLLKNTRLIEHHITCGTINIWGGPEKPGYWIYCLTNGEVKGRVFRQRFKGYRIEPVPDLSQAMEVPKPFGNIDNIMWKCMVGEGDRHFLELSRAADCLNYWAYVKEIIYRLPLQGIPGRITQVALLTDHQEINHTKQGQYFISADMMEWEEVYVHKTYFNTLVFLLSESLAQSRNIYFRFIPSGEAALAGIAALS